MSPRISGEITGAGLGDGAAADWVGLGSSRKPLGGGLEFDATGGETWAIAKLTGMIQSMETMMGLLRGTIGCVGQYIRRPTSGTLLSYSLPVSSGRRGRRGR